MGRKTIENQIHSALSAKIAFGESKHKDKIEQGKRFGESTQKIYSFGTYDRQWGSFLPLQVISPSFLGFSLFRKDILIQKTGSTPVFCFAL